MHHCTIKLENLVGSFTFNICAHFDRSNTSESVFFIKRMILHIFSYETLKRKAGHNYINHRATRLIFNS